MPARCIPSSDRVLMPRFLRLLMAHRNLRWELNETTENNVTHALIIIITTTFGYYKIYWYQLIKFKEVFVLFDFNIVSLTVFPSVLETDYTYSYTVRYLKFSRR